MPEITKEGRYSLKIVDALFRETKDDGSFVVSLKLETEDGYYAWYDLLYTHAVIQIGSQRIVRPVFVRGAAKVSEFTKNKKGEKKNE